MSRSLVKISFNLKITIIFAFLFFSNSFAQISGSNSLEYQIGNLPDVSPANRSSLYNQLNLFYRQDNLLAGTKIELYKTADQQNSYSEFSQKFLRYRDENLQIQIGNFYEVLGRGLLLRAFDIPGAVFEDLAARQHYGFYQDIEGISLRFNSELVQAKVLHGNPLDRTKVPSLSKKERRPNLVQGAEININAHDNFNPGILYLRQEYNSSITEFGGFNAFGSNDLGIQYYIEYVQDLDENNKAFKLGTNSRHAFYSSINYSYEWFNVSAELKDYHDFTLNFNEPPSLVREHSYTLLNRSTHAVQPLDERGFQLESILNIGSFNTVTLNIANAVNNIYSDKNTFWEYYADVNYYLSDNTLFKGFIDWSEDPLVNVFSRKTLGAALEKDITSLWSAAINLQSQHYDIAYKYNPSANYTGQNNLAAVSVSHAPDFSFAVIMEMTDDLVETGRDFNPDLHKFKYWTGYNISYQYNQKNNFSLFYGKRRGGSACTGGVCYEVLPFEGIEVKISSIL